MKLVESKLGRRPHAIARHGPPKSEGGMASNMRHVHAATQPIDTAKQILSRGH